MTKQSKKPTDYTGLIIASVLLPVYLLFYFINHEEMGRSVFIVLGMALLAIRLRWDLKQHWWFWGVIAFVLAIHIPLLLFVRWPGGWLPAIGTLPIGVVDFLIIYGAVGLVEKFVVKFPPSEGSVV